MWCESYICMVRGVGVLMGFGLLIQEFKEGVSSPVWFLVVARKNKKKPKITMFEYLGGWWWEIPSGLKVKQIRKPSNTVCEIKCSALGHFLKCVLCWLCSGFHGKGVLFFFSISISKIVCTYEKYSDLRQSHFPFRFLNDSVFWKVGNRKSYLFFGLLSHLGFNILGKRQMFLLVWEWVGYAY